MKIRNKKGNIKIKKKFEIRTFKFKINVKMKIEKHLSKKEL